MKLSEYRALDHHASTNFLRNTLVSLNTFSFVQMTWEKDIRMSNQTGDLCGEWVVQIDTHDGRSVIKKGDGLEDLLIQADDEASDANIEYWKRRDEARNAALAKLTPEDRKALNLK